MTSGLGWPTGEDADDTIRDVVGTRVLTGVQMIDVSRLSAHPVPMVNSGLVTVAGQGPKDSNGAGKSSFIAALSLLSADEQWRLASGPAWNYRGVIRGCRWCRVSAWGSAEPP